MVLFFKNSVIIICNKCDRYKQVFLGFLCGAGCPVGG